MQSIAPVEIEILVDGVEIGDVKRPLGWHGPVSRAAARMLLSKNKAKLYSTPGAQPVAPEPVDAAPDVDYSHSDNATPVEEDAQVTGSAKRIPRNQKV